MNSIFFLGGGGVWCGGGGGGWEEYLLYQVYKLHTGLAFITSNRDGRQHTEIVYCLMNQQAY